MKKLITTAMISTAALQGGTALAVIDVQLMGGARTAKVDYTVNDEDRTKDVKSTELGFAAHLSPSRLLPVSFGFFANMNKYNTTPIIEEQLKEEQTQSDTFSGPLSSIAGVSYGPEIMAWVPIPMFKPFLRLGYVMGSYDYTSKADYDIGTQSGDLEQTITYKTAGYDVGIGFTYSPVPLLGLIVEYNIGSEKLTATKGHVKTTAVVGAKTSASEEDVKVDDMDDSDKTKNLASSAIRLGLSLSF